MNPIEWMAFAKEATLAALLFFVLSKIVPALNRLTNAIYRLEGRLGLEHDSDHRTKGV